MISLTSSSGQEVLLNPAHIILVKETSNTFGEPYVEVYHSAAKAPLGVKESLDDIQIIISK